jgi:predicted transposase/invertase (TIGR01784 family)
MKYLSPRSDVSFKKLFANPHNEKLTIAFLNNILNLSGEKIITEIVLKEAVNLPDRAAGKEIIFDVYCTDRQNNHYIIEMQALNEANFFERSQYYAARALGNQLKKLDDYIVLLPVVFIGVVNYSLEAIKKYKRSETFRNNSIIALEKYIEKSDQVISKYSFINKQTNQIIPVPLLELNFVELPKFKKSIEECTTQVDQWLYLMTQADGCEDVPEKMKSSKEFKDAFETLNQRNWSQQELEEYVEEQEAFGKEERIAQAREEAFQTREEEKLQEGIQKGIEKEKQETAIKMLKKKMSIEEIADLTELSIEEIKILQEKNKN